MKRRLPVRSRVGVSLVELLVAMTIMGLKRKVDVCCPRRRRPHCHWSAAPTIYINQPGSWALPGNGRGLLIVRNNMTISGSRQWDGIVLVGGTLTSNGNNTVLGAVITGLNLLIGESVGVSAVGNGTKTYRYDSCKVANAASRFGSLSPLRNTSADNWASY